jgi:hypothetical protein
MLRQKDKLSRWWQQRPIQHQVLLTAGPVLIYCAYLILLKEGLI